MFSIFKMKQPFFSRRELLKFGTQASLLTASFSVLSSPAASGLRAREELPSEADVVVVGAGGAGLCAAIEATQAGADVVIVEKNDAVGGNTAISTGFFNAVAPDSQGDSVEIHIDETLAVGGHLNDAKLVRILCSEAYESLNWVRRLGGEYSTKPFLVYGARTPRAYSPNGGSGRVLVSAFLKRVKALRIPVLTGMRMVDLMQDKTGRIVGIRCQKEHRIYEMRARRGVVLCCGGFAANKTLCAMCDPRLMGLSSTNQTGSTGDGIECASRVGALLTGMDYIQCIPGIQPGFKTRVALHVNLDLFLWINLQGRRFIAEDGTRATIRDAFLEQPKKQAYAVIDARGLEWFSSNVRKQIEQGVASGQVIKAATLQELIKRLQLPSETAHETFKNFNQSVTSGYDAEFGRRRLVRKIEQGPFFASISVMSKHCTLGGIAINEYSQALNGFLKPIPGLYAAGEVAAGLHGADRLGGNGITEAIVFGRRAGRFASRG